jgi:hypothetical protein
MPTAQQTLDAYATQLEAMAAAFETAANNGTDKNGNNYSPTQQNALLSQAIDLRNQADDLHAAAILAIADSAANAIAKVQAATTGINNALQTIATVQQVIDFAGNAVSFAATIMTGNVANIGASATTLINSIPTGT